MGATPPAAPQSSVRRLACGTVCTVLEYGSVEKIELYHFHLLLDEGGRAHVAIAKCVTVSIFNSFWPPNVAAQ